MSPSFASYQFLSLALIPLLDFLLLALTIVELLPLLRLLLVISVLLSFIQLADNMSTFNLEVSERAAFSVVDRFYCNATVLAWSMGRDEWV